MKDQDTPWGYVIHANSYEDYEDKGIDIHTAPIEQKFRLYRNSDVADAMARARAMELGYDENCGKAWDGCDRCGDLEEPVHYYGSTYCLGCAMWKHGDSDIDPCDSM